jgi:hypothetical protein
MEIESADGMEIKAPNTLNLHAVLRQLPTALRWKICLRRLDGGGKSDRIYRMIRMEMLYSIYSLRLPS